MNENNLDWDDFRLFLAVACEGGLAAASEKTGKSAPTLGRRMLALERRLGRELFNRLPRGYVLTEQGQQLFTKALSIEEGIYPIVSDAQSNSIRFAVYATDPSVKTWARVIGSTPSAQWVQNNIQAEQFIEVTNPRNALDLAVQGAVRAVLPTFVGQACNGPQRISDEIPELEHMQWLVTHHEDRHSPEVRQVINLMYPILQSIGCD